MIFNHRFSMMLVLRHFPKDTCCQPAHWLTSQRINKAAPTRGALQGLLDQVGGCFCSAIVRLFQPFVVNGNHYDRPKVPDPF